jgi:DNA-binding NarL/FixJ family response regulator
MDATQTSYHAVPPPSPDGSIAVAVVEDDLSFLASLMAAVAASDDLRLHGTAASCAQADALLAGAPAHVLVVDLGLPDGSGLSVIHAAQTRWPGCQIMVSTVFGDEAHVISSLEAGATGYLLKDSAPQRLVEDIRVVHGGGSPISPLIARRLLTYFRRDKTARPASLPGTAGSAAEAAQLSPRELQVLELITKGFSYEEIAGLMSVTRNTVLSFVRRIYAKLDVRSQIEAVTEARNRGFLVG